MAVVLGYGGLANTNGARNFAGREEALPEVALTTMYDMRGYRRRRGVLYLFIFLRGLLHARIG